ncbi:UPF0183-domain-containing protein [Gloeopeniophorella convolvens]|nr:UPF0183-domain-containing protein [Gloeopeniophorella convolvens]
MLFSALVVDIRPGHGLGIFRLGASLWTVLDLLRTHKHTFPQVDVQYDPDSSTTPVILHIKPHFDLLFSGTHQRLHTIADFRRVNVNQAFGPTYPGEDLRYPGVRFCFDDEGLRDQVKDHEDRSQEVVRILISQTEPNGGEIDALSEVLVTPAMYGELAEAIAKVHDGVVLRFYPTTSPPVHVRLGVTTAQDLLSDLGPPLRTYYKEDDRMAIHARSHHEDESPESSYFYNYFQHGIDFLISDNTHIVKKIILHSNVPGTPLFQRYKRCPWQIEGAPEDDEDDSPPRVKFEERVDRISHFLSPGEVPPSMHYDRTDDEEILTLPNSTTRLLGFDGVILEATQSAQVVSVTLF